MKRIMVFGVFFFAAAAMGFGLNLLAASNASANQCDMNDTQYVQVCDDTVNCTNPLFPHSLFRCGTEDPGTDPCCCEFSGCTFLCEHFIPIIP